MPREDPIPAKVRRCYEAFKKANIEVRQAEKERLEMYSGKQWRDKEIRKRESQNRPVVVINRCKPAVDQIEGDIRLNPPGPQCHPVGGGADADIADIWDGIIREVEYRSNAQTAYSTAGKYVSASGCGYLELSTEYVNERSFAQQLRIESVEDPQTVFFDPTSRMANRQDAAWAGKIKMYSREAYIAQFGKDRRVLSKRSTWSTFGTWIQDAFGYNGSLAQLTEWTGPVNDQGFAQGPFFVAEFYEVQSEPAVLRLYADDIARFDDEPVPPGVKPKAGEEYKREISKRKIVKYVVDALETLDETDWLGRLIPIFPVLGPEIYIDGKLHRLSLISGALDSQRLLNYAGSTMAEIAGNLTRAPWIGIKGQFEDVRWESSNSEPWAYLEVTPVFATDENGNNVLAPMPQRNTYETSIQWVIAMAQWASDGIKATTSIFDPSLGQQKNDQSGKAIEQLRSESNVGNFSYADNLHRAIEIMYNEIICISQQILDGPRAQTVVKADSQHEVIQINQIFDQGNAYTDDGKKRKANNICQGQYSVRVTTGPSFQTRQEQSIQTLIDFFKVNPQAAANPAAAAAFLRMLGEGNPQVENMADMISPQPNAEASPQQTQQQMMVLTQQNQQLKQLAMQLHQAIQAKLPEIEAKKWQTAIDALTKIRVAEINASKDTDNANADREASILETQLGMAHDVALQAHQQEHEQGMAQQQAAAAAQQTDQQHQNTLEQQQQAADNQPEPANT